MALHVRAQEWLSHIAKNLRNILTTKNGHEHLNFCTEDLCPKKLLILATGAEEEDVKQENMVHTAGIVSLP